VVRKYAVTKILFYLVISLTIYPVIVGVLGINTNTTPFSIYNRNDDGLSRFYSELKDRNYDIKVILSSLKILRSFNKTGLLIIMSPAVKYDLQESLAVLDFLMRGGSVLIVDDFYAANSLLSNVWLLLNLASLFFETDVMFEGFYFNTTAVLMDAESYYKLPSNPIIRNFNDYYGFLAGIDRIITSFPSTISVKLRIKQGGEFKEVITALPALASFMYSSQYSWLETDLKSAYKGTATPDENEWGGVPFAIGLAFELPTGGKFAMITDPDIFSNKLIRLADFDNLRFAISLVNWLTGGQEGALIIFDESHLPHAIYDPFLALSLWFKALTEISSSWIIAPIAPFIAVFVLMGYVPKLSGFKPRFFSRVERNIEASWTRTKIKTYRKSRNFKQACSVLLDYLMYSVIRRYGLKEGDWQEVMRELLHRHADLAEYREDIWNFFEALHKAATGKKKIKEHKFLELVKEYKKISRILLS